MAGDWIKMRTDLLTSPKVVRMSSALKADRFRIVGGLLSVWSLFDTHSIDGRLSGYDLATVDELAAWDGFAAAMLAVGWLIKNADDDLEIPSFDTHNGASAKRRAQDSDRKRESRKVSAPKADKSRTREEERREESNTSSLRSDGASAEAIASKAMRAVGLQDANPSHPLLTKLLAEGVTTDELAYAASEAVKRGKGFAYALQMAAGRREDAAKLQVGKPQGRRTPPPENFENKNYGQGVELV